jgi:lactoylglutathione lyase
MRTLHTALRVQDLARSLDFYAKVGYRELGRVVIEDGSTLAMLILPDDDRVTLELVYNPKKAFDRGEGLSHVAVQVEDLGASLETLASWGISIGERLLPGG